MLEIYSETNGAICFTTLPKENFKNKKLQLVSGNQWMKIDGRQTIASVQKFKKNGANATGDEL